MATKTIEITKDELQAGDRITGFYPLDVPAGTVKSVAHIVTGSTRVTPTRDIISVSGEQVEERRFPLGTTYRVQRQLTASEEQAKQDERDAYRIEAAHDAINGAQAAIDGDKASFIAAITTGSYRHSAADGIRWMAAGLAESEGKNGCWITVGRILASRADEHGDYPDEYLLEAVLYVAADVTKELLRGQRSSRSTNQYANCVEDDRAHGTAEWLRSYDVHALIDLAARRGVTIDEDKV